MIGPYVRLPFPKETSLAELYHENTKLQPFMLEAEAAAAEVPPRFPDLEYGEPHALPDPRAAPLAVGLEAAIVARRTRRRLSSTDAVPLAHLAKLLHLTYGVTGASEATGEPARASPSAGARYPLELFVVARRVDGLAPGVWHYAPTAHALERVRPGIDAAALDAALLRDASARDAALIVLVGAVLTRTTDKYHERGYRLVLLDAGHAAQNFMLVAGALGLSAVGLGGFVDDALDELVMLDGMDEHVVYAIAVGTATASLMTGEER